MTIKASRYHDISCGHRVVNHESKCRHLHGHNYRVHFECSSSGLDSIGRVIDFSVIKEKLCMWLEDNWDHKFLAWERDPVMLTIETALNKDCWSDEFDIFFYSIVSVPFNPTAENMAAYLLEVVGPARLAGTGVELTTVIIEETAKCSASITK
jgi:6-pyruvoyltetrahydropterin/6-carboxytetrahydropterin synthase